jgi:hypothetical protein
MTEPALPSEVLEVLERAVQHPAGLELLERGGTEAVAVLFGVRPSSVERARALTSDPKRREALTEALVHAGQLHSQAGATYKASPACEPVPKSADQLLQEIERYPGGRELLASAPAETVAVLFGAHPFVVAEARARCGA